MFKKIALMLSIIVFAISCGGSKTTQGSEIALITDLGTIDDKSFNQGSWEGVVKYATENNISHKYYQPEEKTTDAYIDSIDLAVKAGAKIIVTPGFLFEPAIYIAQDSYPETMFVLLDGRPQDGTSTDFRIEKNVYSVYYAEEQSGFLAGYAAVKEGYTNLGFMGGMAVPAVIRFGYGFVQGAEYAATELGITNINIKYTYVGTFNASPESQTLAASWYRSGTQVIFACGGGVGNSVMAAAEQNDAYVIGVDVDQSAESPTIITSAIKMLGESVYGALDSYYNNTFPGGQIVTLDASDNGVGLPNDFSKFKNFTEPDYASIYQKLISSDMQLKKDTDVKSVNELASDTTKIEFIN